MEEEKSGYGFQPSYDGDELHCTVTNLHRSSAYKFRVAAYNSEGKSNPSPVVEFSTRPDAPSAPCRPRERGRVQPHSCRLSWDPPKDSGGAEVTQYVLELSEGGAGDSWQQVYVGAATEYVCEGLEPGAFYQTRVYCESEGGRSQASEVLQVQTPPVPPGPCLPPRLVGKARAREVLLRWTPPQADGGSAVSCYSVEVFCGPEEGGREVYQGPDLDCAVSGLQPGKSYGFRVKAGNKAGFGPVSERCDVTTGPGAPEQCKPPVTACRSPSCVTLSWEVPQSNGAVVSEYRLEWGAAEGTMQVCYSGSALSHEMRGLQPATTYYCRVQACNSAGPGPFSEVVLVQTPCSVPAAVTSVQWLRDGQREEEEEEEEEREEGEGFSPSSCLALSWDPPCDHGCDITSYTIDLGAERAPVTTGPVTRHVLRHLQPDTSYRIRIQALNALGAGPFSHTVKMKTKPLPPPPPRLECSASSHQTLRLKWGEGPSKATPTDSLQYHLQMADRSGRFLSVYKGPCHSHKVQRLNESTSYTFRIQAFNEAGEGPFSPETTFTTPRSPPAPPRALKVERVGDASCEVTWEPLPQMKGDPVIYILQCMMGNSDYKQLYKGPAPCFTLLVSVSGEYRFRVCAVRQCADAPELSGPFTAPVCLAPPHRTEQAPPASSPVPGPASSAVSCRGRGLSDEQCAFLILMLFAVLAILIAFVIQYFVIK